MKITKPIKNEKDYQVALSRLEKIFDSSPNTTKGNEAELLVILIEEYEKKHYPIDAPDPVEAIKFYMEQKGYDTKDLVKVIGYKSRISELFHHKRKLNLSIIRKLHKKWEMPLEALVGV